MHKRGYTVPPFHGTRTWNQTHGQKASTRMVTWLILAGVLSSSYCRYRKGGGQGVQGSFSLSNFLVFWVRVARYAWCAFFCLCVIRLMAVLWVRLFVLGVGFWLYGLSCKDLWSEVWGKLLLILRFLGVLDVLWSKTEIMYEQISMWSKIFYENVLEYNVSRKWLPL